MSFYDGDAGRAAVDVLISEGKLVPDFWLRVEANELRSGTTSDRENLGNQVGQAVRFAMGAAGVELPEWASPVAETPDYVWIYPEWRNKYPVTEPYYCPGDMYAAMKKCYGGPELSHVDRRKLLHSYQSISWRSWRRIVPHFSPELSETLQGIEQERGNNGHTFSKRVRIDSMLSGAMIRDGALYEFYIQQGDAGLKQIFHGIGKKAIFGVGAMLFSSGEHDDLLDTAESLEEILHSD